VTDAGGTVVAMEFLKVEFPDDCGVVINGATGTWRTNQTLQFQAGHYIVSLSLPPGTFDPPQIPIMLASTDILSPLKITFKKA
jgi:hypothetical protein